ncbi:MAG: Gfo/Idh/MocA family oxidoreductase, partial [Alphaproteobacteria bacterium]|nr:Gfo/Idh/MocA family oxidoreductase [Alphaproteobacteria bacterium]
MSDPLRIGLIGAGVIGRKHALYLQASPDCRLAGVADPSPDAEVVAAEHDAPFHADFESMLSSQDLDGVIIAAPNDLHEAAGIAAAARGLPMIVEKPIAADRDAAARLTAAAEQAGVPLLVGHHRRYNPRAQRARALVRDGALGRLVAVNMVWCIRKPEPYFEAAWKRMPGGGPILINLIHEIDLLRFICGEIVEVMAMSSDAVRGFEVEDSASVALRFAGGALATVLISDTAPSPWSWEQATGENHPSFPENEQDPSRFFGTEAAMEFPRLKVWRHDGAVDWHSPLKAEELPLPKVDVYAEQIAHFARVIRGEEQPIITGED